MERKLKQIVAIIMCFCIVTETIGILITMSKMSKDNIVISESYNINIAIEKLIGDRLSIGENKYEVKIESIQEEETQNNEITNIDIPCYTHNITSITQYEYDLLCRVAMSETGGGLSMECIIGVIETILNRVSNENFPNTIKEIVYQKNQYATGNNGEPNERCDQAVAYCLEKQTYPSNLMYFRTGHYHRFGIPYKKIDLMYFSTR